jgi:hypothetical protein
MKIASTAVALLFVASAWAQAPCGLNPQTNLTAAARPGVPFTISWSTIPGLATVEIRKATMSTSASATNPYAFGTSSSRFINGGTAVTDTIFTNGTGFVNYQLTAFSEGGAVLCSSTLSVPVQNDAYTRALFERVVVPVAGSVTGAHGSQFRTSLTLTVPASAVPATYSGRIIFHPAGLVSLDDPSIEYTITSEGTGAKVVTYDDIVAAIGATGLGTIDVVPSTSSRGLVPHVTARIYTPEQIDTFTGVVEGTTFHEDASFIEPNSLEIMQFVLPDAARYRASIGVRTVGTDPVTMNVVISPVGAPQWNTQVTLPPNTFRHVALETITGYKTVGGETVTVMFRSGATPTGMTAVLPYYTITNNNTNDLQVFVGSRRINPTDVSRGFIE